MTLDELLSLSPVIPVVTIREAERAVPLAEALLEGGIPVIEVTLRTPAALEAISRIAAALPDMAVLAGTVCTAAQVRDSLQAGAAGLVSPGLTERLAAAVDAQGALWLPGVATASDILRGLELGLSRFKLFPASVVGGVEAVRAFAGPFPDLRFCPTGGVDPSSAVRYLALPNVACVGGSWIAPDAAIAAGNWASIRAAARAARPGRGDEPRT
jgi:2-dehydro-3-deoxyphosphogluconate aldolase/(4S)-4-hydroxy-2-oxoglutarate aldolase